MDISYVLAGLGFIFCLFVLYYWVRILKQISKFEIVYCVENLAEISLIYYFCIPIVNSI